MLSLLHIKMVSGYRLKTPIRLNKFKAWVHAARLRTLPLSVSGIVVGTALANSMGFEDWMIFFLALLTTIAFQVTSNFANDYGDGVKGTDDEHRIGPRRALQSGMLDRVNLKRGVLLSAIIALILAMALIYHAFGSKNLLYFIIFLLLGLFSIWAAIRYTVGNSAYGYRGLGDVFVFIFFGLVSVLGSLFLYTLSFRIVAMLPAISIGLLSVGVLNLNNLRDVKNDKAHGKNTLVVKMGFENGKKYHFVLLTLSFMSFLTYGILQNQSWINFVYLIAYIPILLHLKRVMGTDYPQKIDPELKKLALSTFLLALLFYISINYFF